MLEKIIYRPFKMTDYDDVIALWKRAGLIHKPDGRDRASKIKIEISQETSVFLVAEYKDVIIGSIFGTHDGRKGWINRLAIDPEFQKRGIAKSLVKLVEEKLHSIGIGIISVLIDDESNVSHEVFLKIGYRRHDDIIYYSKKSRDDI